MFVVVFITFFAGDMLSTFTDITRFHPLRHDDISNFQDYAVSMILTALIVTLIFDYLFMRKK